jgi:hypothetical protein
MENWHPRIEEIGISFWKQMPLLQTQTMYAALHMARSISELQKVSLGDVLRETIRNAAILYGLPLKL